MEHTKDKINVGSRKGHELFLCEMYRVRVVLHICTISKQTVVVGHTAVLVAAEAPPRLSFQKPKPTKTSKDGASGHAR